MTDEFTFWIILRNLLFATRWTLLLTLIAFFGGAIGGIILTLMRLSSHRALRWLAHAIIEVFQGTPLLMQLLLCFFGLTLVGINLEPLSAATVVLTLYASAFLAEIWRGAAAALPRGQWEASTTLGMTFFQQMRFVILPQALQLSIPSTVGFLVQLIKSTALVSIIGFVEVTKAGTIMANTVYRPFLIYGLVALIYFALCYPLSRYSRYLEKKVHATR
ncbi:MAG TPA: amino acid ABC transporter permease [Opitutaceae bacterium]|nr:amino acid ABC transporter permease [Opitutaceae bacterium]